LTWTVVAALAKHPEASGKEASTRTDPAGRRVRLGQFVQAGIPSTAQRRADGSGTFVVGISVMESPKRMETSSVLVTVTV
jgi:hypothetical protein